MLTFTQAKIRKNLIVVEKAKARYTAFVRKELVKDLSRWFKKNARTLPWRSDPEPYAVWLSEIMLQQTQVATVIPYFDRFLKKFPEITHLADAPIDEVLKLWAGLGYYSRARNLHKGAQAIATRIRSSQGFPNTREEWLAIPGVGEYTAGAVSSIALNQREAIVDGNVERVLSRLNAWTKRDPKKIQVWEEARALVAEKSAEPRVLNQALMELGALVCRPKNPKCDECPLSDYCKGKKHPERYPEPKAKVNWKKLHEDKWVIVRGSGLGLELYLEQNAVGSWRDGLWDFPGAIKGQVLPKAELRTEFQTKYVVTNHKITRMHRVFSVPAELRLKMNSSMSSGPAATGKWFLIHDLPGLPAPVTKAIAHLKKTGVV
jgi:A/G-specific adenine glycosylase